jgi:hypothetical protein
MRARMIGCLTGLVTLAGAGGARAADPIMPLSQVQAGMHCTAYSVFHGQAIDSFNADVVDIVGESANGESAPRIVVHVSGSKVDATGVGPGFSGSPVYCPAGDGTPEVAGAISETIGDYGGKTVLATPIEQIVNTPVNPTQAKRLSPRDRALLARARPLATPITVGGVDAGIMRGLQAAGNERHLALLAAPAVPADSSPTLPFQPGSAVSVGLSSGDVSVAAIGTVAYVNGADVWAFGHSFDGLGARQLLLQDAYVAAIVNNPVQVEDYSTYKLSGPVHNVGTLTDDGFNAVAGRTGALPPTIPTYVYSHDDDRNVEDDSQVKVADETDVGNPSGVSPLSYVAPLAVTQAATETLDAAPQRVAGLMCLQVALRERKTPLRFCNRYVNDGVTSGETVGSNPLALSAGLDVSTALAGFDVYKGKPIHVTSVTARLTQTRGERQAYLRSLKLPKRARRGAEIPVRLTFQVVRGERKTVKLRWRVPHTFHRGRHTIRLRGSDPDSGGAGFFDDIVIDISGSGDDTFVDSEGPRSVKGLVKEFQAAHRWDGIRLKSGTRFYRDDTYRIGGKASAKIRILPR